MAKKYLSGFIKPLFTTIFPLIVGCNTENLQASERPVNASSATFATQPTKQTTHNEQITLKDFPAEVTDCATKTPDANELKHFDDFRFEIIKEVFGTPADFAGHYYLISFPTPKGDIYTYSVFDCITGKHVDTLDRYYPEYSTGNELNGFETQFLPTSRLFILNGYYGDPNIGAAPEDFQTEYYELINDKLVLLKKTPANIPETSVDSE